MIMKDLKKKNINVNVWSREQKRKTCEIASKIWLLPSIYSVFSKHFFTYFLV